MTISNGKLKEALEIAGEAVRSTRDFLAAGRQKLSQPVTQIGRDIKLREDAESEVRIRAFLSERCSYPVLGEEGEWAGGADRSQEPYWVLDPLDGSFNYQRGIPLYAVSLALCIERTPLLGAIYDPERDELFQGGKTLGFTINGRAGGRAGVRRQILATGIPSKADLDSAARAITEHSRNWTKMRMIGSAALSLAWVAAGRFDGYSEGGIMWWDVAAGIALAEGAGIAAIALAERDGYLVDLTVER